MNPRDQIFAWMCGPSVGCQFAMHLAKSRDTYRKLWHSVELSNGRDAADYTTAAMPAVLADPEIEAALYVFPTLSGADDVATLINDLCCDPLWTCSIVEKLADAAPPGAVPISLLLEMRWLDDVPCNSAEVIGLADFEPMPPTRAAPYVAIGFRNGGKTTPRGKRPEINLCDIPMPMSQDAFDLTWEQTKQRRVEALGAYPVNAAKAQLTFMLPESAAKLLTTLERE